MIEFARPEALFLLIVVPAIVLIGIRFRRKNGIPRRATLLRAALMALLVLTIAEPLRTNEQSAGATVFVVDRSASLSDSTLTDVEAWVNSALTSAGSADRAAVISFADSPELTIPAGDAGAARFDLSAEPSADLTATNMESALAMAQALPVGGSRRIVLVSDGSQNEGEVLLQASQAASNGVPIDVLPLDGIGMNDFRIAGVAAPTSIWTGDEASISVSVASQQETSGMIEISVDGVTQQETVTFAVGMSTHSVVLDDLEPGFHAIEVRTIPDAADDRFAENNSAPLSLMVRDSPALLLVSPAGTDSNFLASAIDQQGAQTTMIAPAEIPTRLSELSVYDAILLNNVPVSQLSVAQIAAITTVTQEYGRGLIVLGGTSAFGPGGYADTELERVLPVTVKVTEGKARQRVALMLIIDKSGSMGSDPLQNASKIDMAKEAARLATGALADGDEIGILVFNDSQQWVVRLTQINGSDDRDRIEAAISLVDSDGGTEIYPALDVGFDEISNSDADIRHVVLLSDGKSSTGSRESYQKLIEEIRDSNTTLSTIAIGEDADTELLQFLAEEGNGNYHPAQRPEDIPVLTLAEAQNAGAQSVIRGGFVPIQTSPSPMMTGFDPETLPQVNGYDYAEARPDAQVVLTSTRDDPLLAKWQYGLGRVVAWTADDGIDFAQAWRQWDDYGTFWSGIVRWALPDPESGVVSVTAARDGADAVVQVEASGDVGDYVDLSTATIAITSPADGTGASVPLYQIAPNVYEVRVAEPSAGAYRYQLSYSASGRTEVVDGGFTIPVSPELQPTGDGSAILETIATRTGGRILTMDNSDTVFDAPTGGSLGIRTFQPIWWLPLSLALLLLLLEIAIRTGFVDRTRLVFR